MTQLAKADLDGMTPDEIVAAHDEGRLDLYLGKPTEEVEAVERARNGAIDQETVRILAKHGRHDVIVQAAAEGRIKPDTDTTTTEETS